MRKWIIFVLALGATALADQTAKSWVLASLSPGESLHPLPALSPLFQLTLSSNRGAAFGILPMAGDVILILALGIVAFMIWHMRGIASDSRLVPFGIGLVIGGAIGNIIDRLQYGHVVDFIHYRIPDLVSNVSNLADHAIVLGVSIIIAESVWRDRRDRRNQMKKSSADNDL
jgi:signal peptidase II